MRAPLTRYPASIYQAELLSEAGLAVTILDTEDTAYKACPLPRGIQRHILAHGSNPWEKPPGFFRLLNPFRWCQFHLRLLQQLRKLSPHLVVAYEPAAMAGIGRVLRHMRSRAFLQVWHFHEYPELPSAPSPTTRWDLEWTCAHTHLSDVMIFPDQQRAKRFQDEQNLSQEPAVVMNCPRRLAAVPSPALRKRLQERGIAGTPRLVLFHGVVGESYALDTVVRSMSRWPADALLVLAGISRNAFRENLQREAERMGLGRKVVFLGVPEPAENWALRSGADLAVTVVCPRNMNLQLCAGAVNKRFESMAVGVAQVTDDGTGVRELVQQTGAGVCVPHDNPEAVGHAVATLLNNDSLRREMGAQARRLHLSRFNYETAFEPVSRRILALMDQQICLHA